MSVDEVLALARQRRIILQRRGRQISLWAPGVRVDRETRAAIRNHAPQLAQLIEASDVRTCPNPDLHRRSWTWRREQGYICEDCARLLPYIERTA
jgi:hypothetical protein